MNGQTNEPRRLRHPVDLDELDRTVRARQARPAGSANLPTEASSADIAKALELLDDAQLPSPVRKTIEIIDIEYERTAQALESNAAKLRARADMMNEIANELRGRRGILTHDIREGISYVTRASQLNVAAIAQNHENDVAPPPSRIAP